MRGRKPLQQRLLNWLVSVVPQLLNLSIGESTQAVQFFKTCPTSTTTKSACARTMKEKGRKQNSRNQSVVYDNNLTQGNSQKSHHVPFVLDILDLYLSSNGCKGIGVPCESGTGCCFVEAHKVVRSFDSGNVRVLLTKLQDKCI